MATTSALSSSHSPNTRAPDSSPPRALMHRRLRKQGLVLALFGFIFLLASACAPEEEEEPTPRPPRNFCEHHLDCPQGMSCVDNTCQQLACDGRCTAKEVCQDNECVAVEGLSCLEDPRVCPSNYTCTPRGICQRHCNDDAICSTPGFEFCHLDGGGLNVAVCTECAFESDCSEGRPFCNPQGVCAQCLEDNDCREEGAATGLICDAAVGLCVVGCASNDDCESGQYCEGASEQSMGRCVQCDPNTGALDCAPYSPKVQCEPQSRLCVECMNNGHCSGKGQCDVGTFSCVECVTNDGCAQGNICDQASFTCVPGCVGGNGGDNCPADTVCDPSQGASGKCVDCLQDTHCPRTEICHEKSCVKGCTTTPAQCDPEQGMVHTDVYCDSSRGQFGECVECLNDGNCEPGQLCDLEQKRCRCKRTGEACGSQSECGFRDFDTDNGPVDCSQTAPFCVNKLKCDYDNKPVTAVCTHRATQLPGDTGGNCPPGFISRDAIDQNGKDTGRQCVPNTSEYSCK